MMADSKSLEGARPVSSMSIISGLSFQLSLLVISVPSPACNSKIGSGSGSVTPKLASEGPIARKRTLFASPGEMMIPPMETLSPVCTSNLVETFSNWAGTVGSGVGVGEGVGAVTVTEPTIPQQAPCGLQKYGNDPAAGNVCEKVAPWFRTLESQNPLG